MEENTTQQNGESEIVPIIDIAYRTLHYWPWILVSIGVCLMVAVAYILRTPNSYTQSASLLIKDDTKGKSSATMEDFSEFGFFAKNTNIQNEVTTLKSHDLMEEVIKRLNLDWNYYVPGRFHKNVAYGSTLPVNVQILNFPDNSGVSLNLNIAKDGSVEVSDLKQATGDEILDEKSHEAPYKGKLGDTIPTFAGKLIVSPTKSYVRGEEYEIEVKKGALTATVDAYESRLNVALSNDKGTVIDLSFTDQNIQRADDVLSTIIGIYNESWIRDKNQVAVSTSNFINERLRVIEGELGNVDSDISSYKSANLVPNVESAATSYMAESQALGQEILGINNQLQMTRYIKNYLNNDASNDKVLPTNTGIENIDIEQQIAAYNVKVLERNNLLSKSSEKNPLVENMNKELSDMRNAIVGSVDNSIVNLQTQMRGLQGARGAATSKLASNPNQAKYLLSVERQQKVKESLYLFLLQKREDNELNQAFTAYNSKVINRPGGSKQPVAPKKHIILLGAFMIGLIIPFGVVYLKETNNTKVRGRKDLEKLAVPLLGEIPAYSDPKDKKSKDFKSRTILVQSGNRDIINEAFRVLRTNTEFARIKKDECNVLALTSFNPGSGKSFITVNLATAIAIKGKRVLVIDGDMRHGSTTAYMPKAKLGLSDYLSGATNDIDSILVTPENVKTLQVIEIGTVPPNPTELLESPRFAELIEKLKPRYDYIIIDCPPIEVVADAQIIDQFADRTIFVVRAGLLERSMLSQLGRLYDEKKYRNMAMILNCTRNEKGRYGYSHSYKYGYGYGYGYGYNYDSKRK